MAFLCGGSAEERCRLDMTSKQEAIISGEQIKNMLLGAYKSFEKNDQYINYLNVLPEPDGPSIEKNSPSFIAILTPSTARTSPYNRETLSNSTAYVIKHPSEVSDRP